MCWITHYIQKIINAKRTLYSAESNIRQTKRGSSFGPDQQKPSMLDLITFAKVRFMVYFFFELTNPTTSRHVCITANTKMLPVLFQRWLLEKSACTLATAHLHTARKRLMFGLWSEKGSSLENYSSILMGPTPMSGWLSPRSYRSIMGYSCFSVEWVFYFKTSMTSVTPEWAM